MTDKCLLCDHNTNEHEFLSWVTVRSITQGVRCKHKISIDGYNSYECACSGGLKDLKYRVIKAGKEVEENETGRD